MKSDYPVVEFKNAKEFEEFLEKNRDKESGVWVKISKKESGITTVTYDEALRVALCYGWIDGQVNKFDEKYYIQKFTPRGPRSVWSLRNVGIAERLIKEGRMREGGLKKIAAAKKDGRWENAYGGSKDVVIPEEFLKEIKKDKKAYEFYSTLNKSNIFAIYYRLKTAIKRETKERRMRVILEKLKKGERFI